MRLRTVTCLCVVLRLVACGGDDSEAPGAGGAAARGGSSATGNAGAGADTSSAGASSVGGAAPTPGAGGESGAAAGTAGAAGSAGAAGAAGATGLPASTVSVDANVTPLVPSIPGLAGGAARDVSALTDASGITADFVQNELIVNTSDQAALKAFLKRWHGEILDSAVPDSADLPGIESFYLVHVDPESADVTGLVDNLGSLAPAARGDLRLSDAQGEKLLAAAAQENAAGLSVVLNFVPHDASVASGSTQETNVGPNLTYRDFSNKTKIEAWTPDATHWSYMQRGGSQNINVADAWRALAATGRLSSKVSFAVFDGGLIDSQDVPAGAIWLGPSGQENPGKCGGNACPWHGTGTVAAGMGIPDNGFGVAGPAGPIAEPILVPSPGDVWSGLKFFLVDVPVVLALKPKIVNFSFTVRIPEVANWALNPPLDILFSAIRDVWGTLVFAAAGNDASDVDETDTIGAFKIASWLPCQSSKVICVGSMGLGATNISTFTNWANTSSKINHTNTVDIFGPGVVWVDHAVGGSVLNEAEQSQGTSVSSPFVAGVAALVWAAKPSLSANQVEQILLSTAHAQSGNLVQRYVNAFDAVKAALGVTNLAPNLSAQAEPDLFDKRSVKFTASVSDIEDDPNCCDVSWSSNLDGEIGTGLALQYVFPTNGTRKVTAHVTDSQGAQASAQLTVNIAASAPTVSITRPDGTESVYVGLDMPAVARAGEDATDLCLSGSGATLQWASSNTNDTFKTATVCATTVRFVGAGTRTLSFSVTDKFGVSAQKTLAVNAQVADTLVVKIASPVSGDVINKGDVPLLQASVTGGVTPYTHRWIWRRESCADYVVPIKVALSVPVPVPSVYEMWDTSAGSYCTPNGTLTLEVTDAASKTASDVVNFTILVPLP